MDILAAIRGVSIIPENSELTSVQAAGILNVSRPYLIKLHADRAIPYRKALPSFDPSLNYFESDFLS